MRISQELTKGTTAMLVLGVISRQELYGYRIIKEIERQSGQIFSLREGTLYPILHAMEQDGLLDCRWEHTESARKRKYYRITRKGQRELSRLRAEWKAYASMVEKIVDGESASREEAGLGSREQSLGIW